MCEQSRAWRRVEATNEIETQWVGEDSQSLTTGASTPKAHSCYVASSPCVLKRGQRRGQRESETSQGAGVHPYPPLQSMREETEAHLLR